MKAKAYTVKLLITCILQCNGLSWWRQPDHKPMEVFNNPIGVSKNVALPSVAVDLPRARDILPGHTLIRPDMGSLRSAVKFPNKELEDGARVYGNIKSIGASVGNNERIVNTGFRRSYDDGYEKYIHSNQMKPNRIVPPFLPESKGHAAMHEKPLYLPEGHALTLKKPPKTPGTNIKQVLLYGSMMVIDDDNTMVASSKNFRNARKYIIILVDKLPAKKKKVIKLLSGSSEEDDKTKINMESSKILAEFPNDREHSPLWKDRKVLRAGVHEPKPMSVAENPEIEDKKKYYVPPQRLVDYLNSRDLFDHVKISDLAPTLKELVPISPLEENNIRKWWFFNQDDYKPFLN